MLIFTIGLPRSGKSTWATEWAKECPMRTIVSSDSIRKSLTGRRYEPLAETMVFATKHIMIRSLLDRGFDVCVDGTHSSEISLTRIFEIDINAKHVIIDTPLMTCIARANECGQSDLVESIYRIHRNLYDLDFYCGPDQINSKLEQIKKKVIDRGLYERLD